MPDLSRQLWGKSLQNDVKMQNHEACVNYGQKSLVPVTEAQGKSLVHFQSSFILFSQFHQISPNITLFSRLNQDQRWLPARKLIQEPISTRILN